MKSVISKTKFHLEGVWSYMLISVAVFLGLTVIINLVESLLSVLI